MAERVPAQWRELLADPKVKRWHDNLARGSVSSARQCVRTLHRFLKDTGLSAHELVAMTNARRNDLVTDYVGKMLDAGKSGSYTKSHKQAVSSWLSWNGKALTRSIKISRLNVRATLRRAHMPSQEELRQVLNAADARARTAIAFMAYSGVRPEVLGNHDGSDGLCLRDLPEATLQDGRLTFEKVPTRVMVREELSKTKKPYFTFLGPEGCQYLAAYVRERHEAGESMTLDSFLFRPRKTKETSMATNSISILIRRPMRASGMHNNPPYIWRSYFSNRTLLAEGEGLVHDFRVYMMGHQGSLEIDYGLRKTLQMDVVDRMRLGYKAALKYLETQAAAEAENPRLVMVSTLLEVAGYTPEQVQQVEMERKAPHELVDLMRGAIQKATHGGGKVKQKTVTLDELDSVLATGWVYRAPLPNGRILVEAA